jgi:hypothetical protein
MKQVIVSILLILPAISCNKPEAGKDKSAGDSNLITETPTVRPLNPAMERA